MKKCISHIVMCVLLNLALSSPVLSWDDKVTHRDISEIASNNSILSKSKGDYLKNLGFDKGLMQELEWGTKNLIIKKWLAEGAELEDASAPLFPVLGTTRSFNHFHNPLRPWDQAGLNDKWTGKSSLLWAQDGIYQQNFPGGDWSWQKIRDYYYLALTSATDIERQEYFARVFSGVGHQMHLIQDAAQPDHVRNDAHPEDAIFGENPLTGNPYFESWAKSERQRIIDLAANPVFPNVPFNISYNSLALITQLIDTDRYDGLNASAGINQGIAEYTNANFFSNDTIFAAERYSTDHRHYFPYPQKSSTDLQAYITQIKPLLVQIAEDGIQDKGTWIKKIGDGETIDHFVRTGRWTSKIYKTFGEGSLFYSSFYRDDECHKDYAFLLIPRAIGYSAGLINYFFRGQLGVKIAQNGITVKNINTETMESYIDPTTGKTTGNVSVYYDDTNSIRRLLTSYDLSAPLAPGQEIFIPFTEPPDNVKRYRYIIVFNGKLGNEEGAVIGKVTNPPRIFGSSCKSMGKLISCKQYTTASDKDKGAFQGVEKSV